MSDSPLDDICDKLGIGKRVPGPMGSIGGPDRSDHLREQLRKMMDQLNKHTTPRDPAEKVVMGPVALAELRAKVPAAPGPDPSDPLGIITGIRILESEVLEPDQWIAYDRKGQIVAMGRASSIGIFAMRKPQ